MTTFNNLIQQRISTLANLAHKVKRTNSETKKTEIIIAWYNENNPLAEKFSDARHTWTYDLFSSHTPNDWLENTLADLLHYMTEYTFKSADYMQDLSFEIGQSQADIYNHDLYKWFYNNHTIDDYIDCQIIDGVLVCKTLNQLFLDAQAAALDYLTQVLINFLLDNSNFPGLPELPE